MTFSIIATYPLRTYRGSRPDGTVDRMPSVARLYSALLAAAGFGPRATVGESGWGPCEIDAQALRWLENNPPTSVSIPPIHITTGTAIAYRNDGTIGKVAGRKVIRKIGKQDSVVAVDGEFVWSWSQAPPHHVASALRELCSDVSHLGTADSPVLLDVTQKAPAATHELDPDADLFALDPGHDVDIPTPGRLDELAAAHLVERTGRVGSDKAGTDERSTSRPLPTGNVRSGRYRAIRRRIADVPWPEVLVVPLSRRVADKDRVRVAVAAHRTLIKILDRDSPPILTGDYPDDASRPSNRVALQIIDGQAPTAFNNGGRSSLAVMIPSGARPADIVAVRRAVSRLRILRPAGKGGLPIEVCGPVDVIGGDQIWREPESGTIRLWRTDPAAAPDTRGYRGWTFTHAVLLSLGYIWQGTRQIGAVSGTGAERANALVNATNAAGAVVLSAESLADSKVHNYVHKMNRNAVVRPYRAVLALGDLCPPRTLIALGQSRHLGGGLLVPEDYAEGETFPGGISD
ncbi:type I-G CRISPR-associated protein Csb2 [Nocardia rhizosphaerihabitans]|uniref:Type I-U CRISPR-associated protein Cas5/Cas6 n=1 Tax=Nocardia rhizosphaerihabitans TaxID=1691570 RepID=A0ABQ2L3W9_9NOCA|nr:type I-U CRISPR-associated protein Csb2 [Nocardia rhizosphaerihabitans]GGO01146.1 hypothetical protein GCM10011610_70720 [Nocardia rhizosphaerihabitans]